MMKKRIGLLLVLTLLLSSVSLMEVLANTDVTVTVDGEVVEFDQKPIIDQNNRTLVPVRFITEKMGATVEWDGEERLVTINKDGLVVILQIDNKKVRVRNLNNSDYDIIELDTNPIIKNGRTLVPVRFISETFDAKVEWVNETRTVVITTKEKQKDFLEMTNEEIVELVTPIAEREELEVVYGVSEYSGGMSLFLTDTSGERPVSIISMEIDKNGKLNQLEMLATYTVKEIKEDKWVLDNTHYFDVAKEILNVLGVPVTDKFVKDMIAVTPLEAGKLYAEITKDYGEYEVNLFGSAALDVFVGVKKK